MTRTGAEFHEIVERQRAFFRSGATQGSSFRRHQLEAARALVDDNESRIHEALRADLGKSEFEAFVSETGQVRAEVNHTLSHFEEWMEVVGVGTPLSLFPSSSEIRYEPKGVCLLIAPWNYPFQLVMAPLVGALGAGNCAVVKPSELAPATATLTSELLGRYFSEDLVRVVTGGADTSQALLRERFDHIFFTGSPAVGKIVAKAAAEHLTPVTLELGGKSPAIVDETVDLRLSARRIAWSKYLNAGQTCIAPDYVLIPAHLAQDFETRLTEAIHRFYGADPKTSPDFARIVSDAHFDRVRGYLDEGRVVVGGETDRESRYIAPTVLAEAREGSRVLEEEIFGPVLPLIPYRSLDDAIEWTRRHPDPLALYVFSKSRERQERLLEAIPAGGSTINDALVQFSNLELPFGGRGGSGAGSYHGRFSFETFSHKRAIVRAATWIDPPVRYPPYRGKLRWLRKLLG